MMALRSALAAPGDPYHRRWNRLAIASLVVSFLFWPVGLPMAITALVQKHRRNNAVPLSPGSRSAGVP